jgi:hypothetical protein
MGTYGRSIAQRIARRAPRLAPSIKDRTSPHRAFLDVGRDTSRGVIVLGSARSGTTMLAELLASGSRTRFICEPLHFDSPFSQSFVWGSYRDPDTDDAVLEDVWTRALNGSLRSRFTDRFNSSRYANRRVVKCVASPNLASWLANRFHRSPIVYIIRNPMASASSIDSLANRVDRTTRVWKRLQGPIVDDMVTHSRLLDGPLRHNAPAIIDVWKTVETGLERSVLRWCLENYCVLTDPPRSGFRLVRFEELVVTPEEHIEELAAFTRLDLSRALDSWSRPSHADVNRRPGEDLSVCDRTDRWRRRVSLAEQEAALRILRVFQLEDYATPCGQRMS